jgi:hypothetical protein
MSRAVGDLQTQWQAVRAAPLLYIAATAAIILLVWTILHFLYRHRIDGLKEDLGREERECGRLRHKLDELIASNAGEAPRLRQESTPPSPRLIGAPHGTTCLRSRRR